MSTEGNKSEYSQPFAKQDDEYWYAKGVKLAARAIRSLNGELALEYPIILPAVKINRISRNWTELMKRADRHLTVADVEVDAKMPVVAGFVEGMEVSTIDELHRSRFLIEADQHHYFEPMFEPDDYTAIEQAKLTHGFYLPAVRVIFVPNSAQPTPSE